MNNADFNRYMSAKTSIKSLITYASKSQDMLSKDLNAKINGFTDSIYGINKRTPKSLGVQLRAYADGLRDAYIEENTVFLYKIGDKFYRTSNNEYNSDLPCWDTLPREQWPELGQYGDIYWRDTLNPYFIRD